MSIIRRPWVAASGGGGQPRCSPRLGRCAKQGRGSAALAGASSPAQRVGPGSVPDVAGLPPRTASLRGGGGLGSSRLGGGHG
eukprot:CAMPEP_0206845094 /NCGR_PEP_ID=MMETSP0975-20121206/24311_1 /ASSEMBLY_ACC=CAM_ASM_000399 /TAXON_ID=483370 /ORGANISM="non described non described, Strain CCMP2097" /LENGTH=81 /DNA_ID=CAMNT_0054387667 /DNA_START=14 /DNA_END=256 /DNA_ORIENTATION=+